MIRVIPALLFLFFSAPRFPAIALAEEINSKEQTTCYNLEFQNIKWYQKIVMFFYGVNWDELSIRIKYQSQPNQKIKITSIEAWPNSPEEFQPEDRILVLSSNSNEDNFIQFLKYTKFRFEETQKLIELFNFIYDPEQIGERKIETPNLFEKEEGSMYGTFKKMEKDGKPVVEVITYNSSGTENGYVEITLNPQPELHMEKITGRLKIGITIIATEIAEEKKTKPQ